MSHGTFICSATAGEAKVKLDGPTGLELDWVIGISTADMRRLIREAERHRAMLIAEWERIHG